MYLLKWPLRVHKLVFCRHPSSCIFVPEHSMLLRGVNGYVIFLLHLSVWQSSVQISEILELLGYVFNPFLELFMLGLIFAFLLKQVRRLTNNLKRIFTCMSRFFVLFCPTEFTQGQTPEQQRKN